MAKVVYVRSSAFTRRLGWAPGTVYKKMWKTRDKQKRHEPLSPYDMPPPDDIREGVPRWLKTTLDEYAERYRAARSGDLPEAEEEVPTRPDSP